jgi:para-nitrobenzyl esterase
MKVAMIALVVIAIGAALYLVAIEGPPNADIANPTHRTTTSGDVVGFIGKHNASTWQGIPFAKPPVGDLRWHQPLPPDSWDGVRETVAHSDICPQFSNPTTPGQEGVLGNEDCLYLNVYAPADAPADAHGLPVMFWIYGGSNSFGHAGNYDGSRLATSQGVIVVTINYRLAHLGWFSHPVLLNGDPVHDSGNYGTLDIIRALQWTQENIAEFGGDPNNVTAFGESAGGYDVMTLVASPLAAGLFHRGIVQSGGLNLTPIEQARQYADEGGDPFSAREIVNQLLIGDGLATDVDSARAVQNGMEAEALKQYLHDKSPADLWSLFQSTGFGSIPTPTLFADGHVLPTADLMDVFGNPELHNNVPMILGTNRDEVAVYMFASPAHVQATEEGERSLKNEGAYLREVKYGSLVWKEDGVDRFAIALTKSGNKNVYAYRFDWDEQGVIDGMDLSKALGAAHAVELPFVFGDFSTGWMMGDIFVNSEDKYVLANNMMSYWSQFALSGNPGKGRDGALPQWQSWGTDGNTTLVLDTPSDKGIHMLAGAVTPDTLKADLIADASIPSALERCKIYAQMFLDGPYFDASEFGSFGNDGCEGLDARELRGF